MFLRSDAAIDRTHMTYALDPRTRSYPVAVASKYRNESVRVVR
jgi:hypothetical protein